MYTAAAILYPRALATSVTLPMEILQAASQMASVERRGEAQVRFLLAGRDHREVKLGSGVVLKPDLAMTELPSLDEVPREVVVRFRDERANDVRIAGDFNGWIPDKGVRSLIESEGDTRVWTKILQLPPGQYEYRYVVDGEWREDPDNAEAPPAGPGRSVLVVR